MFDLKLEWRTLDNQITVVNKVIFYVYFKMLSIMIASLATNSPTKVIK